MIVAKSSIFLRGIKAPSMLTAIKHTKANTINEISKKELIEYLKYIYSRLGNVNVSLLNALRATEQLDRLADYSYAAFNIVKDVFIS